MQENLKRCSLILTSDWHLRSTIPICRKDDFLKEQERKVDFILRQSLVYNCPILIAGDIGDKPQWENWVLKKYIEKFKKHSQKIYVLPGQHDLPNHRLDKLDESGLGVLIASKAATLLLREPVYILGIDIGIYPVQFKNKIFKVKSNEDEQHIVIIHQLVSQSKLWEGQRNFTFAKSLLKKFPCYKLIVSGDNHQSFVEEYEGRLLVNPGSIMRTSISQKDFKPAIYLWYVETNTIKKIFIPIEQDGFKPTSEVIEMINIEGNKFIQTLKKNYDILVSFENNMRNYLNRNHSISKKVKEKIYEAINLNKK